MPYAPVLHRPPGPARRGRVRLVAVAAAAAALMAGCTIGPSIRPDLATSGNRPAPPVTRTTNAMPLGPGGPGRTADPIRWTSCPGDIPDTAADGQHFTLDCAAVVAPISYPQPRRGSLTVQLARARPAGVGEEAAPLVVLGDPGRSGRTRIAEIAAGLPEAVRHGYSVIIIDPRGTGGSAGIDCVTQPTARAILGMAANPSSAAGAAQLTAISRQLTFDCGDTVGPALTKIDSTNAADDLDTVRAALGRERLTLLASGAGATIGAVYVDRYPGRVGAVLLDSPADPLTGPERHSALTAAAATRLLDDFAASCGSFAGGCPLGADPAGFVQDLVDRLATSGETAGDWVMTSGSILLALLTVLPSRADWPGLADAIAELAAGRADPLADLLTAAMGGEELTARLSADILYGCNDTAVRLSPDRIAELTAGGGLFGPFTIALAGLCAAWPAPDEPLGGLSGAGAAPVLVIGSAAAPTRPFEEVQSVARQLASATLVTWQSETQPAYPASSCVAAVGTAYLLQGVVPDRGVLCPP